MKDISALRKTILNAKCLGVILVEDKFIHNEKYETQLRCPFHGPDNHPSSRYYPDTDSLYCWKCQKKWDVFEYVKEKNGLDFYSSVDFLVKKFNIDLSKVPDIREKFKKLEIGVSEIKVNKKSILLIKMEEKILSLHNKLPFDKYNSLVFGFLLLRSSLYKNDFEDSCARLINDIKESVCLV